MNSLQVLYIVYFISIGFLILAIITSIAYVIPLQLRQVGIKNGLALLRKQLLLKGVLSVIVSIIAICALLARFVIGVGDLARYVTVGLVFIFSICIFLKAYIDSQIYHQQYTPEHIKKSQRVQAMIDAENKAKKKK